MRRPRYPETIQRLVRALVKEAIRMGFHGRARVDIQGPVFVITIRVRDLNPFGGPHILEEMSLRERKRLARLERG